MKSDSKQATALFVSQSLSSGVNFVFMLLYARLMSIENFGSFSLLQFLGYLFIFIQNAAIYTPMNVNIHKYKINESQYHWLLVLKIVAILLISITFSLILCSYHAFSLAPKHFFAVFLYLFFFSIFDFFRKYNISKLKYTKLLLSEVVYTILIAIIVLLTIFISKVELNIKSALLIPGISYAMVTIFFSKQFIVSTSHQKAIYRKILVLAKKEMSSIIHLLLSNFSQWGTMRIPVYILSSYGSLALVGALSVSSSLIGILNPVYITIDSYLLPRFARSYIKDGAELTKTKIALAYNKLSIYILASMLLITPFSKIIYRLFLGDKYIQYHYVFQFIMFSYLLQFLSKKFVVFSNITSKQKYLLQGNLIVLIFTCTIGFVLVKKFNLIGTLICINISWIIYYIYLSQALWKSKKQNKYQSSLT